MADRDRSKRPRSIGNWTEHFSSSGKRYFYNHKTEVSQWEKPQEWREHERSQPSSESAPKNAPNQPHHDSTASVSGSSGKSAGRAALANSHRRSHDRIQIPTSSGHRPVVPDARKNSATSPRVVPSSAPVQRTESTSRNVANLECKQEEIPMDVDEESRDGDEADAKPEVKVKKEEPKPLFADDPITFSPEKYFQYLPKEFVPRRNIVEHAETESLRAEVKVFGLQNQIDRLSQDIKCSKSLVQTAHVKVALTDKRLDHTRKDLKQLEEEKKPPTRSFSTTSQHSFHPNR
uniref:WW domain-containing protein n=1 Tax=Steinernema glaseri TaxID=37863 RepID=A0A1I8AAP0_9BILA